MTKEARSVAGSALLLACAMVLGYIGLRKHGFFGRPDLLHYGGRLEACTIETDGEVALSLSPGSWYLFLIGTVEQDGKLIKRLQGLLETPRLRTGNLIPVVLMDGEEEVLSEYSQKNSISIDLLPLHQISPEALTNLGVYDHRRRYFLISPDLTIHFYSEFMKPRDLTLLLEKHFRTRTVDDQNLPLVPGDRFPDVHLIPVGLHQRDLDRSSGNIWIIFTSTCISCALQTHLHELAERQGTLSTLADAIGRKCGVIFSPSFDLRDVFLRIEAEGLYLPTFVAMTELTGIEDSYSQQPLHGWDIVVIETDQAGEVQLLQPLNAFIDSHAEFIPDTPPAS